MDLATGALNSAVRVGIQIVLSSKRPMVEIYHEMLNRLGPEHELDVPMGSNGRREKMKHRFGHPQIAFRAVNIGGVRAENVRVRMESGFERPHPRSYGQLFQSEIPNMSPGQVVFLLLLDDHELNEYARGGGVPTGMTTDHLCMTVTFNGPWQGLNRILRLGSHLLRRPQFTFRYAFNPQSVYTDLPPQEYA